MTANRSCALPPYPQVVVVMLIIVLVLDVAYRSEIRLTVENISNVPIDFYKLSFEDSTIAPAQQLLAEGELSVADAYETEHDLVHRPFFRWNVPDPLPPIPPGKRLVVPVQCHGKVGCAQGSVQMSYSYVHREPSSPASPSTSPSTPQSSPPDTFHARQITYPVNITVYHTLEFSNLDIIPLSSSSSSPSTSSTSNSAPTPSLSSSSLSPHTLALAPNDLTTTLASIPPGQNDYCLVSLDVNNIYGLPFDVTLERHQDSRCHFRALP